MEAINEKASLIELGLVSADDIVVDDDAGKAFLRAAQLPLRRLGLPDLYVLLRFNVALAVIVPIVLQRLADKPMLQAAEYPADLLSALLESDAYFWKEQPTLWEETLPVLAQAMEEAQITDEHGEIAFAIGDSLAAAILHFMSHHKA